MKNEYTVTQKLYRTWALENMCKGIRLFFFISWMLLGLLCLWVSLSPFLSSFFRVMALFCFYRAFLRNLLAAKKQYQILAKTYGQENWTRTIVFEEDKITTSEPASAFWSSYSDIVNIREKSDKIWLILNNKTVIRLYKSAFINTTWEECKAAILSRKEHAL